MHLWQLAVFLSVLVTIKAVTLDPTFWAARSARGDPIAAIDGEEWTTCSTVWPANTNDYIWVDMLTNQTFDNLNMSVGACQANENIIFVASYSSDNVTWVPFWTQGLSNLSVVTYNASQQLQARYLLFKLTNSVTWCSWLVNDIFVNLGPANLVNPCLAPRIKTKGQAIYNTLPSYDSLCSYIAQSSNATYYWPTGVNNSLVVDWEIVSVVEVLGAIYGNQAWIYKYGLAQNWAVNGASILKGFLVALSNVIVNNLGAQYWIQSVQSLSNNFGVGMAFEFLENHPELGYQLQGNDRVRFFQALKIALHDPTDWIWWVSENSFVDGEAFAVAYLIATTIQYEIKKNPNNTYLTLNQVNQWLNASAQFGIQVTQGPVSGSNSYQGCCGFTCFGINNQTIPNTWSINMTTPNQGGRGPRIQSDSATYGGGSLGGGVGPYLFVHYKYPNPFSPEYNNPTLWKLIGDWAEGYANLHMPYTNQQAVMFNYGDASYFQGTAYFGSFFEVMATITKNYNLPQAMRLKKVANMFWMYQTGGTGVDSSFLIFGDETIPLNETWIPSSYATYYWTQLGVYAQDKLILRANATPCNRGNQTSVALQVRNDGEHGHGDPGNLHAYYYKGQQIIHNYGYDATPDVLNHLFLIRPSQLDFLFYSNYREQLGPSYSRIEPWGWSNGDVPSDYRFNPSGFVAEFDKVAYARVDQYYYTNYDKNYFPAWQNYSNQVFNHSREVALDRTTGAVFIFDTCISWNTLNQTLLWSYGPLWHISQVFQNLTNGVIGQDGDYWNFGSTKSAPFSLTMAGPNGTTYRNIYWKFQGGMSGDWGQVYHLNARYVGPVYAGVPISFLTAIVPFDSGDPNNNVTAQTVPSPPNYSITVSGGTGTVSIGNTTIHFGKSNLNYQTGPGQYANYPVKFSFQAQNGLTMYTAGLLDDGNNTKVQTTFALPSQCSTATVNTDATRNVANTVYGLVCDNSSTFVSAAWYRFSGAAGTILANYTVSPYLCGTYATGYSTAAYPSTAGNTTAGTACFNWSGNTCQWSSSIQITNCNGYYVFYLPPAPACYLRYCTM